jgi:hypothetical protein
MIDRRNFFRRSMGLTVSLGTTATQATQNISIRDESNPRLNDFERTLANTRQMEMLGLPRSWWVVRERFHPISPERVVILQPGKRGWCGVYNDAKQKNRLVEEVLTRQRTEKRPDDPAQPLGYPLAKLDMILRIIGSLTSFYGNSQQFHRWSSNMAYRESLASTGVGGHSFLLHDFQYHDQSGEAPTTNGVMDWWLFLFPTGIEWDGFDEKPVHLGLGPIFSDRKVSGPGSYLRVLEFQTRTMRAIKPSEAIQLSRMDRVAAARWLNFRVAGILAEERNRR